nr:magnesium and cobalt transport protein CorA [Pseudoclavibacter chungangensis]
MPSSRSSRESPRGSGTRASPSSVSSRPSWSSSCCGPTVRRCSISSRSRAERASRADGWVGCATIGRATGPPAANATARGGPVHTEHILDVTVFVDGEPVGHPDPVAGLEAARRDHGWVWVELADVEQIELDDVARTFGLGRLFVEDVLESGQRTKLERHGDQSFVVLHPATYDDDNDHVDFSELSLFVGPDFLVTVQRSGCGGVVDVRKRLRAARRLAELGPSGAAYAILDEVVDGYQHVAEGLALDIEEIDAAIDSRDGELAKRIYRLTGQVSKFLTVVTPLESMLTGMRRALVGGDPTLLADAGGVLRHVPTHEERSPLGDDDVEHRRAVLLDALFGDVLDHVIRLEGRLGNMRSVLDNALTLVSTLASQRATEITLVQADQTKKISSWAAIFAAPTIVTGIYGMNFTHMPELDWTWGYAGAWGLMVCLSVGLYIAFKRNNWL